MRRQIKGILDAASPVACGPLSHIIPNACFFLKPEMLSAFLSARSTPRAQNV